LIPKINRLKLWTFFKRKLTCRVLQAGN
jgi:hypothetical protein